MASSRARALRKASCNASADPGHLFVLGHPVYGTAQILWYRHSGDVLSYVVLRNAFRKPRLEETRGEVIEVEPDDFWIGCVAKAHGFVKPVPHSPNDLFRFVGVALYVYTRQVGQGDLEIMGPPFQDQELLVLHELWAVYTRAIIDSELERHVQAIKLLRAPGFQPRKIVNAQLRLSNQLTDLFEPALAGIRTFNGNSGAMA